MPNHRSGGGHRKRGRGRIADRVKSLTDADMQQPESTVQPMSQEPNPVESATPEDQPQPEIEQPQVTPAAPTAPVETAQPSEPSPKMPSFESLFPDAESAKLPTNLTEVLARGFRYLFQVPKMAGAGNHWPLVREEEVMLATVSNDCIKTLPQKQKQQTTRFVTKWLPWLSLAAVTYMITWPRMLITQRIIAARVRHGTETGTLGTRGGTREEIGGDFPRDEATGIPSWEALIRRSGGHERH